MGLVLRLTWQGTFLNHEYQSGDKGDRIGQDSSYGVCEPSIPTSHQYRPSLLFRVELRPAWEEIATGFVSAQFLIALHC